MIQNKQENKVNIDTVQPLKCGHDNSPPEGPGETQQVYGDQLETLQYALEKYDDALV